MYAYTYTLMYIYNNRQATEWGLFTWTGAVINLQEAAEEVAHISIIADYLALLEILVYVPTKVEAATAVSLAVSIELALKNTSALEKQLEKMTPDMQNHLSRVCNHLSAEPLMDIYGCLHHSANKHTHTSTLFFAVADTLHTLKSLLEERSVEAWACESMMSKVRSLASK